MGDDSTVKRRKRKRKPKLDLDEEPDIEEDEFDLHFIDYFDIPEVWKVEMYREARKLAKKRSSNYIV